MEHTISKAKDLESLREMCECCQQCDLGASRQKVVFGEGNPEASLFFLGEAPGAREDESGRPFVGRAGELLDNMLAEAGLSRNDVYITGSCKCRPPKNRNPKRGELQSCRPWLQKQLELIKPEVVVCLGLVATQNMLGHGVKMAKVHGHWFEQSHFLIYPTYHPAAVLRNSVKPEVLLADLQAVAAKVRILK
jgi:uracil-DNA glycosylase